MSSIRVSETVRCRRRRQAGRRLWSAPTIRDGRIQAGTPQWIVHEFAEADYCYGVGPLTLKVDRVGWDKPVPYEGDTWLEVEGIVIDRTGNLGPRRQFLIRAERLPAPPPGRKRPRLRP